MSECDIYVYIVIMLGCSSRVLSSILFFILVGIDDGQIECPEHAAGGLEGDAIGQRHETKVDELGDRPDLPVGNKSRLVKILIFFLYLREFATFHYSHRTQKESEPNRCHENLVTGDPFSERFCPSTTRVGGTAPYWESTLQEFVPSSNQGAYRKAEAEKAKRSVEIIRRTLFVAFFEEYLRNLSDDIA